MISACPWTITDLSVRIRALDKIDESAQPRKHLVGPLLEVPLYTSLQDFPLLGAGSGYETMVLVDEQETWVLV